MHFYRENSDGGKGLVRVQEECATSTSRVKRQEALQAGWQRSYGVSPFLFRMSALAPLLKSKFTISTCLLGRTQNHWRMARKGKWKRRGTDTRGALPNEVPAMILMARR